jgi:hypothetical protein
MTVLVQPIHRWYCPNCRFEDVTREAQPHTRYHTCPKLRGLSAPMVRAGSRAKVYAREREDYIGGDLVQTDEAGRPVMAVVTERDDGSNDVAVFAPTATGSAKE